MSPSRSVVVTRVDYDPSYLNYLHQACGSTLDTHCQTPKKDKTGTKMSQSRSVVVSIPDYDPSYLKSLPYVCGTPKGASCDVGVVTGEENSFRDVPLGSETSDDANDFLCNDANDDEVTGRDSDYPLDTDNTDDNEVTGRDPDDSLDTDNTDDNEVTGRDPDDPLATDTEKNAPCFLVPFAGYMWPAKGYTSLADHPCRYSPYGLEQQYFLEFPWCLWRNNLGTDQTICCFGCWGSRTRHCCLRQKGHWNIELSTVPHITNCSWTAVTTLH